MVQYSMVQYRTVQYRTVQYRTVQYRTVQYRKNPRLLTRETAKTTLCAILSTKSHLSLARKPQLSPTSWKGIANPGQSK
jgi:hypothetical protein